MYETAVPSPRRSLSLRRSLWWEVLTNHLVFGIGSYLPRQPKGNSTSHTACSKPLFLLRVLVSLSSPFREHGQRFDGTTLTKKGSVQIFPAEPPDSPLGTRESVGFHFPLSNPQQQRTRLDLQVFRRFACSKPVGLWICVHYTAVAFRSLLTSKKESLAAMPPCHFLFQ